MKIGGSLHPCTLLVIIATSLLSLSSNALAEYTQIIGKRVNGWAYVDKFCFDGDTRNYVEVSIRPSFPTDYTIAIYASDGDVEDLRGRERYFLSVYASNESCEAKTEAASFTVPVPKGVQVSPILIPRYGQPKYWYLAVAICDQAVTEVDIGIQWMNSGDMWTKEVSFDRQGLAETYIAFTSLYLIGFVAFTVLIVMLKKKRRLHMVIIVFYLSFIIYFSSMIILLYCYIIGLIGHFDRAIYLTGQLFANFAQLGFTITLLLLAKGWGISTSKLSRKRDLAVLLVIVTLTYIGLYLYDILRDRTFVSYLYDFPLGVALLAVRLCVFAAFLMLLRRTVMFEEDKRKRAFLLVFGYAVSLYFLLFIALMIAVTQIAEWDKERVGEIMRLSLDTLGFFGIPFLFRTKRVYEVYNPTSLDRVRIPTIKEMQQVKPVTVISAYNTQQSVIPAGDAERREEGERGSVHRMPVSAVLPSVVSTPPAGEGVRAVISTSSPQSVPLPIQRVPM
mmetsp:Transcript_47062/g.121590  ORF Transcript_47062/g.121590 Transcript_47062/m.121590 type:complete len:504 (-) Transcript_47062:190-1701(-)|eukprot:CAMPEP_0113880044 /NCGR_PEP_ID=MMETSP0780_2-20120614/7567_1 /TAXON_ID=652834 /ORGANISM="Palpitomonas bilix" /LENGTH=503 /DNA_ID=CAMNT_0000866677 /DNA_START=348 /DNA_END=1859 /DNA_ORIENTATION=- /assembly_acc=CAM_ASM_000599